MTLKIMSWNVRGVNNQDKRKVLKAFIRSKKVDIVCLQEIKVQNMCVGLVHSLGVGRFLDRGSVDAEGSAGGILVFWDKRVVELVEMEIGIFSVSCCFKNCIDGFQWMFSGVYGPIVDSKREFFWEELGAVRGLWNGPSCVGGDFNAVRFPGERRGGGRVSNSMRRFSEIMEDLGLRDIPLQRGPFTWRGGRNNCSMSRIDCFLVSNDWESYFSGVTQSTLPRPISDHCPIFIDAGGIIKGPIPFRFEVMWLKVDGFKELVKGWWQGMIFSGFFSFVLAEKLKALFSIEETEARYLAREDYKYWSLLEEVSWRQKSRELLLKEGDKNTSFFHRMANSHRRINCIKKVRVNGN